MFSFCVVCELWLTYRISYVYLQLCEMWNAIVVSGYKSHYSFYRIFSDSIFWPIEVSFQNAVRLHENASLVDTSWKKWYPFLLIMCFFDIQVIDIDSYRDL